MEIEVVEYDPRWPAQFGALRRSYEEALVGVPIVGIEHVGSTSVVGLAAKPVIDVDIVVAAGGVQAAIAAMGRIGFESRGERGIQDRYALRAPEGLHRTNTYVIVEGSLALRNHLAIRDHLRRDVNLCHEYAALKRTLATSAPVSASYVEQKSAFLLGVLAIAGFTPDERQAIEQANRLT